MINTQKSKEKIGQKLTATINNSPIRIVVETLDGEEFPLSKAYFVGGRAAEVKILIGGQSTIAKAYGEIEYLKDTITSLESDIEDLRGYKNELEKWEDEFPHDTPDALKSKWDAIEEAVAQFADVADMILVNNDADNIDRLQKSFELRIAELKDADEIIGELKQENLAAQKRIKELEAYLELVREQQLADKDI